MAGMKKFFTVCLILSLLSSSFAADVILNEYNAVDATEFLGGGTIAADESGGRARDSYFGRVMGNGGDWFELVVITDHLDMRNWHLDVFSNGILDETLDLTNHSIWSDLRSGTIITVSEDVPTDISYNPAAGDWWINVRAENTADGLCIEPSSFPVSATNWQIRIRNAVGGIVFGPAGEGISPASGISSTEVFRLEADPSALITPASVDYDDGSNLSTFGSANQWGQQELSVLRRVVAQPSTLTLVSPNGSEIITGGSIYDVAWTNTGVVGGVFIEFSLDNGRTWSEVYPQNFGNTGHYNWLVPAVDSEQCLVRVSNAANPGVFDRSNAAFTIFECVLDGDLTGDCIIDFSDFAVMANSWLECANPYSPACEE